jgi:hypothetical protein
MAQLGWLHEPLIFTQQSRLMVVGTHNYDQRKAMKKHVDLRMELQLLQYPKMHLTISLMSLASDDELYLFFVNS